MEKLGEFSGSGDNYIGKAYLSGGVINTCNLKINLSSDNFGRWKCGKYNLTISRALHQILLHIISSLIKIIQQAYHLEIR